MTNETNVDDNPGEKEECVRLQGCGLSKKSPAMGMGGGYGKGSAGASKCGPTKKGSWASGVLTSLDWQEQGSQRIQSSLGNLKIHRFEKNMLKFPL